MDEKQSRKLSKEVQKRAEKLRDRMGTSAERELVRVTRDGQRSANSAELHSRILAYIGLGVAVLSLIVAVIALGVAGA